MSCLDTSPPPEGEKLLLVLNALARPSNKVDSDRQERVRTFLESKREMCKKGDSQLFHAWKICWNKTQKCKYSE